MQGVSVEEQDEDDYVCKVRDPLMEEVLKPLSEFINEKKRHGIRTQKDPCKVMEYLENVKAGKSSIAANFLLPHEIIGYVNDTDFSQLADRQWKAMVEELYLKQGKLKNAWLYVMSREGCVDTP